MRINPTSYLFEDLTLANTITSEGLPLNYEDNSIIKDFLRVHPHTDANKLLISSTILPTRLALSAVLSFSNQITKKEF